MEISPDRPVYRQSSGLTLYAFSCGYVQRAELDLGPESTYIRVDLWQEHGMFHVRTHDFNVYGRMDWKPFKNLTSARNYWKGQVNKRFSASLRAIAKDKRYTVTQEYHGEVDPSWILRFEGEWVEQFTTELGARLGACKHRLESKGAE